MKLTFICIFMALTVCSARQAHAQNVQLDFDLNERGAKVSPNLIGIFFEEINHAGEGGLYAELIANRSFEDNNGSTDSWTVTGGTTMILTGSRMITSAQHHALDVRFATDGYLENTGYWGISVTEGETYKLTFWSRATTNAWSGDITASLVGDDGKDVGTTTVNVNISNEWNKYETLIKAVGSARKATFRLSTSSPAALTLDIVSLFPPTFKDRENGMRRDLAQMLYDIHPRFVRFPGGCYVEGDYRGAASTNRYEWKKTIGPIENRSGHFNQNWGYYIQDGMGFHEYLQMCEDLGAEALFVVNVGLGHNWLQPYQQLDEYVQEALDAIEYANGDTSTRWGAERARNGHPEPFKLKYIEIGNENYNFHIDTNQDQSEHYPERYYTFYKALKQKYPEIILVGNVESWGTDAPSWRNNYPVEMVDEHYYRSPSWFANNYEKYDTYDRKGPKIYVGEYAVTQRFGRLGSLEAALGEAIFIQGMERNSDIVSMSSYAPIFINENAQGWMPDMIRFNAYMSYGTPSYYVQRMFGQNQGTVNITWTEKNNTPKLPQDKQAESLKTKNGLASWLTQVEYSNISITDEAGQQLYNPTSAQWTNLRGRWRNSNNVIRQLSNDENTMSLLSTPLPDTFVYNVTAKKIAGDEGFLIVFDYKDDQNFTWINIGGWGNTQHGVEQTVQGVRSSLVTKATDKPIETGRDYQIRIERKGQNAKCYVDNQLIFDFKMPDGMYDRAVYTSAALDENTGKLIIKLTNPNATDSPTRINITGGKRPRSASAEVLSGDSAADENSTEHTDNIVPKPAPVKINRDGSIDYNVKAFSLNIITLSF